MSHATLVVGLGGTGVLVARHLKRLYGRLTPSERVPAKFLAFDLDAAVQSTGDIDLPTLEDGDEFVFLDPSQIQQVLRNLDRAEEGGAPAWGKILEWFPDRTTAPIPVSEVEANGASQFRALGRVALFRNTARIEADLRRKLAALTSEVDDRTLSVHKRVLIVSSVAGGTGAGMLIDTAYLARRQDGRPRVLLYLLLPDVFQDVDNGGRIFQNAYASLREIAHLKDQIIPFHADYLDAPPVHVNPGSEEPFARVFLCRGQHFSGAKAVHDACALMAQSIVPQLHRTVQEKSLAMVSNAVSSESRAEQARRRKQCFASASASELELRPASVTPEAVFPVVIEALRDPHALAGSRDQATIQRLRDLERRLAQEGVGATGAASAAPAEETFTEGEAPERDDEPSAQLALVLARRWHARLAQHALVNTESILANLTQQLIAIDARLRAGHGRELTAAGQSIDGLAELLLADFTQDKYEANLGRLKAHCPSFLDFEKHLAKVIDSVFDTIDMARTADLLERQRLYAALRAVEKRFSIKFPARLPESIAELRRRWESPDAVGRPLERPPTAGPGAGAPAASGSRPRWALWRSRIQDELERIARLRRGVELLREALADSSRRENINAILKVRAFKAWWDGIQGRHQAAEAALEKRRNSVLDLPALAEAPTLTPLARERVLDFLRRRLAQIVDEGGAAAKTGDTPVVQQREFMRALARIVAADKELGRVRFEMGETGDESGAWQQRLRRGLVQMRANVFERRTPNPQRKALCVAMLPAGTQAVEGFDAMSRTLSAHASQILNCVVQVEQYTGSHAWVYFEDLFNPGDHVYNLDEYYRTYQSQSAKELFHIDRRFLAEPAFEEIHSGVSRFVITCGNKDCRESISSVPRSRRICPRCHNLIRSRCGNEGCTLDDLHDRPHAVRTAKTCPSCGNFNWSAWWVCSRHGKVDTHVPVDKRRCPECVKQHLADPVTYPQDCISVRFDLKGARECPNCARIRKRDSEHQSFAIPQELLRFYEHGVNGHDQETFRELASRHKLIDRVRCPRCLTLLIPSHDEAHHEARSREACP